MKTKNYLAILGLPLLLSVTISNKCGSPEPKPSDIEVPPSLSGVVDHAPTVGFCELVDNPEKYNNQIVRTNAIFYRDRENSVLYSSQCNDTKKDAWADFDPSNDNSEESVKKKFNEALCISKPCPSSKATVIVVGRFEGPNQEGLRSSERISVQICNHADCQRGSAILRRQRHGGIAIDRRYGLSAYAVTNGAIFGGRTKSGLSVLDCFI